MYAVRSAYRYVIGSKIITGVFRYTVYSNQGLLDPKLRTIRTLHYHEVPVPNSTLPYQPYAFLNINMAGLLGGGGGKNNGSGLLGG